MAKKGTRKSAKGYYLTQRLWSPFGHVINATGNTVGEVAGTAGNIVKRGLTGAKRLGNIWTGHANMAVKDLTKRKSRRANMRRANMRKGTRKNRA
jgi:hypothetical protein